MTKQEREAQERRDRRLRISAVEREAMGRVGQRIAHLRREAGVTQRQLADHLGITETMMSSIERGIFSPYKYLDAIGEKLNKDRSAFIESEDVSAQQVLPLLEEVLSKLDQILVVIGDGVAKKPSRARK